LVNLWQMKDQNFSESITKILENEGPIFWQISGK